MLGLGAILGVGSGIAGLFADNAKNKRSKQELAIQRDLANRQIDLSQYIEQLSRDLMSRGSGVTDGLGQTTGYDTATGQYTSSMRPGQVAAQNASDQEEIARYTLDQEMRRAGLRDAEAIRSAAVPDALAAQRNINLLNQGIGAVDPRAISSDLELSRRSAINAGYDDAERAAQTMALRTGSSAVESALTGLARDRARTQAQVGATRTEGLQLADSLNAQRQQNLGTGYDRMASSGRSFYDAAFTPSQAADNSFNRAVTGQQLDLSRSQAAMGGAATAAAGVGSAAAGQRQAFQVSEQNRVHDPWGSFLSGLSGVVGAR